MDLLSDRTKSLPEPMLTYGQYDPQEHELLDPMEFWLV